ncbi:hypothetical protein H5399_05005 [Tessaracoccus sp. MC1627]|uniref:DUF7620 family protein n=1 Tax=Tessaracoccus sp. MC1627 TaxID=2760312 RepID=UPI0015FEC597|nr:hypothetical protein [Tessaracoccus sp. MC1627]MBB1511962.1 hypothetical protein [Tessaracoccus sp. MC1627]
MSRRARMWWRLTPPRIKAQVEAADEQLDRAREAFAVVADREQRVVAVSAALDADRIRNGYAERVATALGGRYRWTT